jgi:hypothetical protein
MASWVVAQFVVAAVGVRTASWCAPVGDVRQTCGGAGQAVAVAAYLPAQPVLRLDRGRYGAGLVGGLSGVLWPAIVVHVVSVFRVCG